MRGEVEMTYARMHRLGGVNRGPEEGLFLLLQVPYCLLRFQFVAELSIL